MNAIRIYRNASATIFCNDTNFNSFVLSPPLILLNKTSVLAQMLVRVNTVTVHCANIFRDYFGLCTTQRSIELYRFYKSINKKLVVSSTSYFKKNILLKDVRDNVIQKIYWTDFTILIIFSSTMLKKFRAIFKFRKSFW